MKSHHLLILFISTLVIVITSCDNSYQYPVGTDVVTNTEITNSEPISQTCSGYGEYETDNSTDSDSPSTSAFQLTGRLETCNKCQGSGMLQDDLYSQPKQCPFCIASLIARMDVGDIDPRSGIVDAAFNALPSNYFDGFDYYFGDDAGDCYVENDVERLEEEIANLQNMLDYIDSSIYRTQIQQEIIEKRAEIRRLRSRL